MCNVLQPSWTKRLAVVSPYGTLRGIYSCIDTHEGHPAFARVMKDGMDPSATTCVFYTSMFGTGARWYFGTALPKWSSTGGSMRSFSISLGDASGLQSPEHAQWPGEDIFEIRDATDEDEENIYFFPKGPNEPRRDGFNPKTPQVGESMHSNLKVLGLPTGTLPSLETLRGAYRKLARTLHPDKGGTKEEFQVLQSAYEAVVEVVIQSGGGVQSEVSTQTGPCGGCHQETTPDVPDTRAGYKEPTPDEPDMLGDAYANPELSEEEKQIRRQKALEAALERQGQTS